MTTTDVPSLLTVRQFAERHPAFSESSIRWLLFRAGDPDSGFADLDKAIVRVGRRVLLDEAAFFEWVQSRRAGQ